MPLQRYEQDSAILFRHTSAPHHHAIQSADFNLIRAKTFAYHSLNPVARHGQFGNLAGNGQTQAGISQRVRSGQNGEMAVAGPYRLGEDIGKGVPASQPGAARKASAADHAVKEPAGRDPWRGAP